MTGKLILTGGGLISKMGKDGKELHFMGGKTYLTPEVQKASPALTGFEGPVQGLEMDIRLKQGNYGGGFEIVAVTKLVTK